MTAKEIRKGFPTVEKATEETRIFMKEYFFDENTEWTEVCLKRTIDEHFDDLIIIL